MERAYGWRIYLQDENHRSHIGRLSPDCGSRSTVTVQLNLRELAAPQVAHQAGSLVRRRKRRDRPEAKCFRYRRLEAAIDLPQPAGGTVCGLRRNQCRMRAGGM